MKIKWLIIWSIVFISCSDKQENNVVYQVFGNDTMYICDASKIKEFRTIKISDLVSDFKIVHFEDSDTALFKAWKIYITDHYIGILQDALAPFKLFDHNGKFICDVGSIGQGPGEYTMLYSAAIDETLNTVCLAPFSGTKLLKYDLNGNFKSAIEIGKMHKPQIRFEHDGSITLTHLCFKNMSNFQYVRIDERNNVSYILPIKHQTINAIDKDGNNIGYNAEVWFYNNSNYFTYMTTAIDTLYKFNIQREATTPRFVMKNHNGSYCIYNELPYYFVVNINYMEQKIWEPKSNIVFVDKYNTYAYYANVVNDKIGCLPVESFPYSNNGWYYEIYEPFQLIEKIDLHLKDNKCSNTDKIFLKNLKETIDENENDIMFIGKINSKTN